MNSNQTVLMALEKEGVVTTEEALLRAVEEAQTIPFLGTGDWVKPSLDDPVVKARPPLAEGGLNGSLPARLGTPRETNSTASPETQTEHPVPSSDGKDGEPTKGIWRRICALAGMEMCHLGIHPAPWVYLREGHCDQLRDCQRCATTRMRVKHRREWRYVTDQRCEQKRVCKRCDHREDSRTNHEAWSESWSVGRDMEAHRCKRCGEVESFRTSCGD